MYISNRERWTWCFYLIETKFNLTLFQKPKVFPCVAEKVC
jgi:hypothetical protein